MLQEGQLQQFEAYCEKLYTSPDANERAAAEAALVQLSSSSEYIPQCQFVLDHSKLAYAQLVAANALKKLLMQSWNHLTIQQRVRWLGLGLGLGLYISGYIYLDGQMVRVRVRSDGSSSAWVIYLTI